MNSPAQASTELDQLAHALTSQGYRATVITPAPYLAIYLPGAPHPYMIYASDGRYWWAKRSGRRCLPGFECLLTLALVVDWVAWRMCLRVEMGSGSCAVV